MVSGTFSLILEMFLLDHTYIVLGMFLLAFPVTAAAFVAEEEFFAPSSAALLLRSVAF